MSDRPGWVGRLGDRGTSTSQPPPSRPEPGPGYPVRSNGPERAALGGPGPRARQPVPGPEGPALRVVLVSRDKMLAGALRSLIEAPGGVRMLDWYSEELDSVIRHADVVVVDMPPTLHERTFAVLDGRFLGRTVVLLQEGEHAEALPPGATSWAVLYRPLQIGELWSAVTGATEPAPPAEPESGPQAEPEPHPEPEPEPEPGPEAGAGDEAPVGSVDEEAGVAAAAEAAGQGLPVSESGRLIGLSGQELDPVIGPGQVAPGMDGATFERLAGWKTGPVARPPAGSRKAQARQEKATRAEERQAARADARTAAREESLQAKAARAEARRIAREERQTRAEEARQAKAARGGARLAAREEARQARAARTQARAAARAEARQARATRAEERRAARADTRQAAAAEAEARRAARDEERQARSAEAEEWRAAQEAARRAEAAEVEARKAERAEARRVAREEAVRARAERRDAARQARSAKAEERRAARAEAAQQRSARAEARKAARAEGRQVKAAQAEAQVAARREAEQARAAEVEARKAERAEAERVKAAEGEARREESRQAKAAEAASREAARAAAARERAARAEAQKVGRREAEQARAARADERRAAKAARDQERQAAKVEAGQRRAAEAEVRRERTRQARAAKVEARQAARAQADQEKAAKAEARAAQIEERRAARKEARAGKAGAGASVGDGIGRVIQPAVVGLLVAVLGVAAAGWVGDGGAETRAGEVAVVRAAGGSAGGLVAQDPRVGPIAPLHALGVGVWLRVAEARSSLEGAVREARVPSRFLLAGVVGLTVVLFLLLMRVGPGSGAAAGPGPAPPQWGRARWRLGGAALAGALVALDPLLVRSGRAATGTVLAVLVAVGTVALAWGVPARPALRWLPLVAAGGGLALLVSPLALPVLAVPVVAELLQGRYQDALKDMAALGLAIAMWLLLPVWVAGQDLGAGQAGWLLGRPPGRGSVAASLSGAPFTWLLLAAGLVAAGLTWRHRSGARSDAGPGTARLLAWTATTVAGALGAIAIGYPAEQALPFAVPAAAVSVAIGAWALAAAAGTAKARRVALAGAAVVLAGLLAGQVVDWGGRYGRPADDGLGRLVATVRAEVPECSAVNAGGPDDRARLLAAGVTVTEFSDGPAAHAAGVRYFVLTGATGHAGPMTPSLAAWVRRHGSRLAAHPSRSLSGVELWRVDAAPLDPVADLLPLPNGVFSNTTGSACGGYRVVDSQVGSFHSAYRSVGGKAVLGRPLGSVWTSDGPALQAFDTMVLGAVPTASGPPAVRPIELPPLLAKLDVEAVADADIPLPSVTPPVTNRQTRALLRDEVIGRAYLGSDPATATPEDFRRARDRFGRPLGLPQMMPDGAIRQPFERAVLEVPADGGPVRPAALGRLAVRLGLVPRQAMRPEPVPGLPARPAETRLDPAPLLRLVGGALALLLLAAGAGAVLARRSRAARAT